jgi:hypothetical protein
MLRAARQAGVALNTLYRLVVPQPRSLVRVPLRILRSLRVDRRTCGGAGIRFVYSAIV